MNRLAGPASQTKTGGIKTTARGSIISSGGTPSGDSVHSGSGNVPTNVDEDDDARGNLNPVVKVAQKPSLFFADLADTSCLKRTRTQTAAGLGASAAKKHKTAAVPTVQSATVQRVSPYVFDSDSGEDAKPSKSQIVQGTKLEHSKNNSSSNSSSKNRIKNIIKSSGGASSSTLGNAHVLSHSHSLSELLQQDDLPLVDKYITKSGSGSARTIKCNFCKRCITGRNRSRWQRHIRACTIAPAAIKALFPLIPRVSLPPDSGSPLQEDDNDNDDDEDVSNKSRDLHSQAPLPSETSESSPGIDAIDYPPPETLREAIEAHVIKTGQGIRRLVQCKYCESSISSNYKTRWQKHVANCEYAPEWARQMFFQAAAAQQTTSPNSSGAGGANGIEDDKYPRAAVNSASDRFDAVSQENEDTTLLSTKVEADNYDECGVVSAGGSGGGGGDGVVTPEYKRIIYDGSFYVAPTGGRSVNGELAKYPCPPEPILVYNGNKPNTEGWRAWMDVMRYQRPNFHIENKTGVRVTKFKRAHNLAPIKMMPRSNPKQYHSNLCSAIPERLHLEFLEFMDGGLGAATAAALSSAAASAADSKGKINAGYIGFGDVADEMDGVVMLNAAAERGSVSVEDASPAPAGKPKYIEIVKKIIPAYRTLSEESRKAVKRGVRNFLEVEFQDRFTEECVQVSDKGTTYVIPETVAEKFKEWAYDELSRVFPNMVVAQGTTC
ncbi:hypothetical protein HK100_008602 [Physocladia obscura]|uniref:Uncharacterized protein n=1 Tax=Physocladia obscura TaxID=109957 RepID=A0AAD5SMW9_9FUNG|nr:hypothetical protein HK100_008602 [Physocladia obscura]